MNRSVVSTALVFILSLMAAGCRFGAETNLNATATATPAKPAIDAAAIEAEVLRVEREWFKAGETYDLEAIKRIVADDAVLIYPDGTPGTKADEVRLVESKAISVSGWEIIDPKVTVLSADSAFISGRSRINKGTYKDQNMQRPVDISGEYRFLDVYARRDGRWQVIASAATRVAALAPATSPAASPTP